MGTILSTLISFGPTVLRLIGKAKGGNTEFAAEQIADLIDNSNGKPEQAKLDALAKSLDPQALKELELGMAQIEADKEKAQLNHDLGMHQAQQKTLQSTDIKGIRPTIANRHSWFTAAYISIFEGLAAFDLGTGANWEIAMLIASPTLAWFGFRTWDKFSKQGATQ